MAGREAQGGQADGGQGPAEVVRALLARRRAGVLSTQSVARPGYPFGSGVSFALSARGAPLLLISELAAHTKNLRADARACLFVSDAVAGDGPGDDAQAATRASLLGRAALVPAAELDDARARYRDRFAAADGTLALGGFALWELHVDDVRWIEGFGRMGWLGGAALAAAITPDAVSALRHEAAVGEPLTEKQDPGGAKEK